MVCVMWELEMGWNNSEGYTNNLLTTFQKQKVHVKENKK